MKNNVICSIATLLCISASLYSSIPRVPSLDFLRGDAIPWSVSSFPCIDTTSRGNLTIDHYGECVNTHYIGSEKKEIRIGSQPGVPHAWVQYIQNFTAHNNFSNIDEINKQRAIKILHILQTSAIPSYHEIMLENLELKTNIKTSLESIVHTAPHRAIERCKHDSSESALNSMKSEWQKLSKIQQNEILALHGATDIKEITHRHAHAAITEWMHELPDIEISYIPGAYFRQEEWEKFVVYNKKCQNMQTECNKLTADEIDTIIIDYAHKDGITYNQISNLTTALNRWSLRRENKKYRDLIDKKYEDLRKRIRSKA